MKVGEIMSKDVKFINKNKNAQEAAKMMEQNKIGSVPVEDNNKLIGMVTDRDLTIKILARGGSTDTKLAELVDKDIKYCYEDEEASDVAAQMSDLKVRRMPVMNRNKDLVGIVSIGDLAKDERCKDKAIQALKEICQAP